MEKRNNPKALLPNPFLDRANPGHEEIDIAAKLVDYETTNPLSFFEIEEFESSKQRCEDTSAINVAYQQATRTGHLGHAHVDDVMRFQIDFRGRSCSFQNDDVIPCSQNLVTLANYRHQFFNPALVVLARSQLIP